MRTIRNTPSWSNEVLKTRGGNHVYHVWDGEEALDYLFRRKAYADPDKSPRARLVLLDFRLPKIDGMEVLNQIRASEELRTIPVVVLTSSNKETDIAKAYDNHVNSYLVKPIDFTEFDQMMDKIAIQWLGWNRDY